MSGRGDEGGKVGSVRKYCRGKEGNVCQKRMTRKGSLHSSDIEKPLYQFSENFQVQKCHIGTLGKSLFDSFEMKRGEGRKVWQFLNITREKGIFF